ncbi:MAG TPA: hypothetical protein DCL08_00365 [Anaerolineaceae bacterium]|nr:hypothetical protein [Anaerolineaceae bacterium]
MQPGCRIHSLPTALSRLAAQITQGCGSNYQMIRILHLSGSEGNFSWVQQGEGLSLAHTALSASADLLSFVTADNIYLRLYYR